MNQLKTPFSECSVFLPHGCSLQRRVSLALVSRNFSQMRVGRLQERIRVRVPKPQVSEQPLQLCQELQTYLR